MAINSQLSPSSNSDNFNASGVSQTAGAVNQSTTDLTATQANLSAARLAASGLGAGATNALQQIAGKVFNFDFRGTNGTPLAPEVDWRVRVSMQPVTAGLFYTNPNNTIMHPLIETGGVIFPYTPTVTLGHTARYGTSQLTHSNYNAYFYEGSEVQSITINGDFTVQNIYEGQYLMAVVQFFRACTKMFFGGSELAGTPPPMVFLDGYGPSYLPHVPCVVTAFNHTMPGDVDYIDVPIGTGLNGVVDNALNLTVGNRTRLPTNSTISITLQPVYSRNNIANNFTLEKFSAGALIQGSTSPVGGFI